MPRVLNRTGAHWQFGALRLPPGESYHDRADVLGALHATRLGRVAVLAGKSGSARARFVVDMDADLPVPPVVEADPPDEPPAPGRPLRAHSKAELLEIATGLGIEDADRMRKRELIAAIRQR